MIAIYVFLFEHFCCRMYACVYVHLHEIGYMYMYKYLVCVGVSMCVFGVITVGQFPGRGSLSC